MNLIKQYEAAIQRSEIQDDENQREILISMQRLADELACDCKSWFRWPGQKKIKGLYIYGPVGVGKTYLVDLFFQFIAEEKKARFHFHHFMQQIDFQLRQLQGRKDPLRLIAKKMAKSIRLLCFDEFLVHDVAYAMILAELFQALHAHGVILVVSSNTSPDDLYRNGVHRERFLPAIEIIKNDCEVIKIPEKKDYRIGHQPLLDAYLYPLGEQTEQKMKQQFQFFTQEFSVHGTLVIQSRDIPYIQCGAQTIWFSFDVICNLPRSQLDYLELADRFDTIFVSGIPCLTENHTLQTIMFIHFIDVMYDRGINVIMSADVPVEELYIQGEMKDTFKRTLSRLMEMQSVDYLGRHPRRIVHNMLKTDG
ncbi:cell division protein ZapE [Legionella worsleiensis]|uniref:ATPase N2B (Nucleotide (GTP) binding protein) n=1 Tax=Legionella worsleiensis TaxID=45076 RepID=A0A0W1AF76_9GAMM|nr:cell division protein ZapE [Legionella worsleiensis]KTD80023.1 ATPase N2B (nucleotide (GTP) binding protein) [Legionella worsleiensis]STY32495.1 ATPase N2B (nucleotide (GTP) binding protein) [Legionella worsleiensis]